VAPAGPFVIRTDAVVHDTGALDVVAPEAMQVPVEWLPESTLVYLMGSRYCETDLLSAIAWQRFGSGPAGWQRVQAICDFVHGHLEFGYHHARRTRSAWEAYQERRGVCRDYAHLAITLCRCMNIPARYCTGYLGDIRIAPAPEPMDFAGWFEAYLGDRWYTFDPRNNTPRVGRVLMARGRDACDVPLACTFGPNTLRRFSVWSEEVAVG
jgi:transglutaminase-like putative cysteine protease